MAHPSRAAATDPRHTFRFAHSLVPSPLLLLVHTTFLTMFLPRAYPTVCVAALWLATVAFSSPAAFLAPDRTATSTTNSSTAPPTASGETRFYNLTLTPGWGAPGELPGVVSQSSGSLSDGTPLLWRKQTELIASSISSTGALLDPLSKRRKVTCSTSPSSTSFPLRSRCTGETLLHPLVISCDGLSQDDCDKGTDSISEARQSTMEFPE